MQLFLLRHGDAVESAMYQDRDRPLSDLGNQQVRAVAHFFRTSRLKPELILTSPLVRAQQTSSIIKESLGITHALRSESLISGNNLRDLMKEIDAHKVESMLLVGHEPQLSALISLLTGGDEQFRVEMKKASLACLELRQPVRKGQGVLTWLLAPSLLAAIR